MLRLLSVAAALCVPFFSTPALGEDDKPPALSARGQVVDPAGRPVAGARVVLREWPSIRKSSDAYVDEVRDILAETKSDAEGRFEFADVESRPFAKGFRDYTPWDVVALADGFAPGWIHLKKARDDQDLTVKLQAAKTVAGRLVDPDGKPVADCKVQVATVEAPGRYWHSDSGDPLRIDLWSCELTPRTTTDEDGRFEFAGIPAEKRLVLLAEHPDFARTSIYAATTDQTQAPVETPSFDAEGKSSQNEQPVHMTGFTETLKPGGRVRGRVVLADTGKPVPGAKVNASWKNRVHHVVADADGRFEFTSLIDPEYFVASQTDEPGYLAAREAVSFSDGQRPREVELRLARGETIEGRVLDEDTGTGVAGVSVMYRPADYDENVPWSPVRSVTSDGSGRFTIVVPVGPGSLQVGGGIDRHPTHDVPDFWRIRSKKGISPHHETRVVVESGKKADDVVLKVGRGLVIRGQVVDESGKPVFAAEVRTRDKYGRAEAGKATVTDDQGRFEFVGFPPHEEQQIEVLDATSRTRGTAQVPADEAAGPDRLVELAPIPMRSTGQVRGTVLGDGKPLVGVTVDLHSMQQLGGGRLEYVGSQLSATTDKDGRFEFGAVDATYEFHIYARIDGFTDQGTRTLKIKPGETIDVPAIEVKSRSAFVAGIVVDPDGKPVAGVTVSASEKGGGGISFGRRGPPPLTGKDGRFRLEDLPNVPLELLAYIRSDENTKDRSIHFPARAQAAPNQTDVRIVLDPKLQRPLP